ncbi:MAG: MBL fold metallo-hydrolase [Clostridiales bacterium]|nr:MBL fold metallo-hydrolase [Clostridiales bacterium]
MNNILSFIPGFRSNTKWKKIIAIIYYAILVLMMFSEFFTALAGVALPFLIFGFSDLIRHKKKAIPLKNAFVGLSLALLVFIFSVGMAGPSENNDSPTGSGIVNHNEDKVIDKDDGQLATSAPDEKTDNENTNKTDDNSDSIIDVNNEQKNDESDSKKNDIENENKQNSNVSGKVVVHYIDVGQGDSILVQAPSFNMLIDGGNRDNSAVNYIKKQGISELDLVISTHPHSDHIGGLINVLEEINVKEVIDPAVVHTTKTFEDYLTLIDEKNIKFTEAKPGMKKDLGNGASLEILGPASASGSNLNDV